MALNRNRVTIAGRVGRDPEIRNVGQGRVANLRVAVSERFKDKSGEWKELTEWVPIVVWNDATVGFIEKHVKKGTAVCVDGQFKTRSYKSNNDEKETYVTEVVVRGPKDSVELTEGFPKREGGAQQRGGGDFFGDTAQKTNKPVIDDLDDSIPF